MVAIIKFELSLLVHDYSMLSKEGKPDLHEAFKTALKALPALPGFSYEHLANLLVTESAADLKTYSRLKESFRRSLDATGFSRERVNNG